MSHDSPQWAGPLGPWQQPPAMPPRSRRSSTNGSTRSPPWRSSSLSNKNLPISSLSTVVAEPEQGAPLMSASESVAPYGGNDKSDTSSGEDNDTWLSSLIPKRSTMSMPDSGQPSSESPVPSTSSSLPPYPSISAPDPLTKSPPLSIPAPRSGLSSCASSSEVSPPPFAPNTPPSYFGSPKKSPIETTARPSVSSQSIPTILSLPSSLDDFVPSLPPTPPAQQRKPIPENHAFNPPSNKFTLSIPLLGRAKVPLESVLGLTNSKKRDEIVQSKPSNEDDPQVSDLSIASSISPSTQINHSVDSDADAGRETSPNSEANISSTSDLDQVGSNQSTSWWNYVGWTSTSVATTTSTAPINAVASIQVPFANDHPELKSMSPVLDPLGNPNGGSAATVTDSGSGESGLVNEAGDGNSVEPVEEKVQDGASDKSVPISSWYSPWSWSSSANVGEHVQLESESLGVNTISEDVVQDSRPEPALAASSASSETPGGEADTPPAPAHPPVNPITTSMEANWGGWAWFFNSRTSMVKTLGYGGSGGVQDVKRDENGMEVMDLDEDETEQRDISAVVLSKDSEPGGSGNGQDLSVMSDPIAKRRPPISSDSNQTPQIELQISDTTGNKREQSAAQFSVSSTRNSGSNTPIPIPLSSSPSSRDGNESKSLANTSTTSKKFTNTRSTSPAPSKKPITSSPRLLNLVLPTWEHTFNTAPRNVVMIKPRRFSGDQTVGGKFLKTMKFVSGVLFARDESSESDRIKEKAKGRDSDVSRDFKKWKEERFKEFGKELPKAWEIEETGLDTDATPTTPISRIPPFGFYSPETTNVRLTTKGSQAAVGESGVNASDGMKDVLKGCKRVVVIGIHGWFPGPMLRTVVGEPTGTSIKFANMTEQALQQFENEHGVKLEKITKIPLEGHGTINHRVEKLYNDLTANESWMTDLHEAEAIIVSTHSQGSIVSTHLLNRLIKDDHITTARNHHLGTSFGTGAETFPSAIGMPGTISRKKTKVQRVCCVALCGVHLGPLRYMSSLVQPYIQYFESIAARELFEFQNTESAVSKEYVKSLQNVLDHGIKMLYVASLNDQVVPIYSGLFTAASHPLILRALYIDGDAYHSSDFVSNLLVLLIRILNSGISDSGLIAHLSEATAGSLSGVGHSTAYGELATFSLAVKYLFLANEGTTESTELHVEPFNANQEQNDYEIPWSLRDIIADERVAHFFSRDIAELKDAFREWHPKTSILRDLKRKLQPITRLPSSTTFNSSGSGYFVNQHHMMISGFHVLPPIIWSLRNARRFPWPMEIKQLMPRSLCKNIFC